MLHSLAAYTFWFAGAAALSFILAIVVHIWSISKMFQTSLENGLTGVLFRFVPVIVLMVISFFNLILFFVGVIALFLDK